MAPALTVTKENVAEGWQQSLHRDAPQSVLDAGEVGAADADRDHQRSGNDRATLVLASRRSRRPAFRRLSGITTGPNGETATPAARADADAGGGGARSRRATTPPPSSGTRSSDYTTAVDRGAKDEFAELGIEVVAQTDAEFDAAKQKSDIETVLAKRPSIILSLPVDPATAPRSTGRRSRPALSSPSSTTRRRAIEHGQRLVTIVSDDLFQMGKKAADAMAAALGGKGKVGYIYHDANFYVTNQRDGAFKETIEATTRTSRSSPSRAWPIRPGEDDRQRAADAEPRPRRHLRHLGGAGAESCSRRSQTAGNSHTKIVTLDLTEPLALDMVKGGNVVAIVADEAYGIGRTAARAAAAALIGKEAAPFLVVNSLAVTKDSVAEGWQRSLHTDAPASVLEAAK